MLPYSHTACFREVREVEVVAGADPFEEQRDAYGARWGIDRLYADYREMLENEASRHRQRGDLGQAASRRS